MSGPAPPQQCGPLRPGVNLKEDQAASQTQVGGVTAGEPAFQDPPEPVPSGPRASESPHSVLELHTPPSSNPIPPNSEFLP